MNRGTTATALLVIALVLAPLTPLLVLEEPSDRPYSSRAGSLDGLEERLTQWTDGGPEPVASVEEEVLVVLRLKRGARLPVRYGVDVRETYTRQGARHLRGYVPLTAVRDLSTDPRVEAVRIERARFRTDSQVAGGVERINASVLHEAGLTGENVTVGVVDQAFRVSDPEIADRVGAYRSFGTTGDDWSHGTAVASVVADTAPDATLHLAAVGTSTTPEEYREAVTWLRDSGADVIVDAGSYFGQPADGTGELSRIATNASRDTVVVAAAGNYGQRHWRGHHDVSRGDWVEFAEGDRANDLAGGEPFAGQVQVSVNWDDWSGESDDYDLYLYRRRPGGDRVVAQGTEVADAPVEHLTASVPEGRYYVSLRAANATGRASFDLFASRQLRYRSEQGSLTAPGVAPHVLTVGALTDEDDVAPFSSRGPVGTRTGVDLVAPDDVVAPSTNAGEGTSYAAPYVAGTAALLLEAHPELTAGEVRSVLRSSARDIGPPGADNAAGYGRLDAAAALSLADEYERYAAVNASTTASG